MLTKRGDILTVLTSMGEPGGRAEGGAEGVLSCIGMGEGSGSLAEAVGCIVWFGSGGETQT